MHGDITSLSGDFQSPIKLFIVVVVIISFITDINECNRTSDGHKCAQICVNTMGSYACACRTGYKLKNNGLGCEKGNQLTINMTTDVCE